MIERLISLPRSDSFFLFGPRQTGKTTLVKQRYAADSWTVDLLLEDVFMRYSTDPGLFRLQALDQIERKAVTTVIVDEVQRLPGLLNDAQSVMDMHPEVRFVFTGSSARKLKRHGVNLLGGRAVERYIHPYVFREIEGRYPLDEVLRYGTLPGIFGRDPESMQERLNAYVNTYLREEIRLEGLVRNIGGFSRFLEIAASQNGEMVNYSDMGRDCGISYNTVKGHYEILEDTLVAFALPAWARSTRRRLASHPRYYFFDLGVLNALNHRLGNEPDPKTRGRLFESLVVLEIRRRLHYARSKASLFFWRTSAGAEVDIVVEKHGKPAAACEVKSSRTIDNHDLSGLKAFQEEYPDVPCFIAGTVNSAYVKSGIRVMPWHEAVDEIAALL